MTPKQLFFTFLIIGLLGCFVSGPMGLLVRMVGGFVAGMNLRRAFLE